jgi:hypothetical protein
LQAFCVGFEEPTYDERQFARRVAEHCGPHSARSCFVPRTRSRPDRAVISRRAAGRCVVPAAIRWRWGQGDGHRDASGDGGDEPSAVIRPVADRPPAGCARCSRAVQIWRPGDRRRPPSSRR